MDKTMLDIYTDYLISSFGQASATALSRMLDGKISHDAVTRFLASEPKRSSDLWQIAKPLVRSVENADEGVLVLDDSIEEKPHTDENEIVCWHWDHSKECHVKGINFLSVNYQICEICLPIAFDLVEKTECYIDEKTGNLKRRSTISKNDRYRMLLRVCVQNEVKFRYVLNDLWFASARNMMFVKQDLKKEFVMPLKDNRKVALSLDGQKNGLFKRVDELDLSEGVTLKIWLEDVPFALLLIKEVFKNEDGSIGIRYLVTSDLQLDYDQIRKIYQRRWSIEVYHKSLKQNASLEKSPTRTQTTQRNHLFASICAYIKLERLKINTGISHFAIKSKIYLSALKAAYSELVKLKTQTAPA
jgi:hypothetical protein